MLQTEFMHKKLTRAVLIPAVGCILPLAAAHADPVTYTYTGTDFTSANAPFSTSDSITGSFTVASALGDDFNSNNPSIPLDVLSYSFTVDGQTISSATNGSEPFFEILTNAAGDVDIWDVAVSTTGGLQFQALVQIAEFGRVHWSFGELRTGDEQTEQHRRVVCRAAL